MCCTVHEQVGMQFFIIVSEFFIFLFPLEGPLFLYLSWFSLLIQYYRRRFCNICSLRILLERTTLEDELHLYIKFR
jgi:hypothetical protein